MEKTSMFSVVLLRQVNHVDPVIELYQELPPAALARTTYEIFKALSNLNGRDSSE